MFNSAAKFFLNSPPEIWEREREREREREKEVNDLREISPAETRELSNTFNGLAHNTGAESEDRARDQTQPPDPRSTHLRNLMP